MKILDKLRKVLFPRQHRESTIDLPTEGKRVTEEPMAGWATDQQIEECFKAWQEGGREGLLKMYKERSRAAKEQKEK
jgi:hypothetical protein